MRKKKKVDYYNQKMCPANTKLELFSSCVMLN